MNNQNQFHYLFKVVLVGNSAVGKSSIVIRYADDQFSDVFLATIGVDFRFKSFPFQGNKVKLQIWDTAGHQRFRTITSSYYRGAHAIMIVFDITDKQSFNDAINYWLVQVRSSCPVDTQILLVGNKCDLQQERKVNQQNIQQILKSNPNIQYIETSAKTSEKIEQAFLKVAGMLVHQENKKNQKKQNRNKKYKKDKPSTTKLQPENQKQQQKLKHRKYCCYM